MPPSEVEKLFRAFAEKRKAELPRFTLDGIPITLENKFDDAIYNYLYAYWKEQSGEYDPKKDVIPESEMNKMYPKTKNEKKFEQWLLQQYGMTKKEQRGYTLEGNLDSLWEIFSAADMVLLAKALPNIGKNLAKLGKNVGDDVAEEAIENSVIKGESSGSLNSGDIRYRRGNPVEPIKITYEMRLNPELYIQEVVNKYGINLKGSGQKINIRFDPDYVKGPGYVSELYPNTIILGPQALVSESELANTIAHELNHWRSWLKGGVAPEPPAYVAGDSLADYINGGR